MILILLSMLAAGDEPTLAVRLSRPDAQLANVLRLFKGTPAEGPAAAWAGWKRATGGTLGRPAEAAIAFFHPGMVGELKTLDGATLDYRSPARWSARLPDDDGTFAALATAMALSGGGPEAPIGDAEVDRVGPPGSALLARRGRGLVAAASDRGELSRALGGAKLRLPEAPESGWAFAATIINPAPIFGRLNAATTALGALGIAGVDGTMGLDDRGVLTSTFRSRWIGDEPIMPPLDDDGLGGLPDEGALVALALGFDPSPGSVSRAFAAADRVERSLPGRGGVGPLRARVDVLLSGLGVRAEAEVWPAVAGVSAAVYADEGGRVVGARVVIKAIDGDGALRLAAVLGPKLGKAVGREVSVSARGVRVVADWGTIGKAGSIGALLRAVWGASTPSRAFYLSAGRLPGLEPRLAKGLRATGPMLGWGEGPTDRVRWDGLKGGVAAFLDGLPMRLDEPGAAQ